MVIDGTVRAQYSLLLDMVARAQKIGAGATYISLVGTASQIC